MEFPTPVTSGDWLEKHLDRVKVVDASWYMPNAKRDPSIEYTSERIPGAVFFDIDGISDTASDLPHMLCSADSFAAAADALGITNEDPVVIYDGSGLFSAARAWWTFKIFGHRQVAVLEGGLPQWKSEGRQVDSSSPALPADTGAKATSAEGAAGTRKYTARLEVDGVRSVEQMLDNVTAGKEQVVDARGAARFKAGPEPRPGLRSGHIPNSMNVPFTEVLTAAGGLRPDAELQQVFEAAGVDVNKPIVTSCGTGVTACVLSLALDKLQSKQVAVYDGSWTEWGGRTDTPIETDE
eukprot:CAMPEP_0197860246 /NCGR_PEP_ID=MMETSP1438-20131217/35467_1 /TAXON_ID=1461541 /ORGANISM="Pterosperma sp., Strain CCMP1384" /LENGTH=294 /DNA_ID=CAMNT_0043477037 /DNA_START=325 /DNA_END=1209 /DNA_ORIENTATION=+